MRGSPSTNLVMKLCSCCQDASPEKLVLTSACFTATVATEASIGAYSQLSSAAVWRKIASSTMPHTLCHTRPCAAFKSSMVSLKTFARSVGLNGRKIFGVSVSAFLEVHDGASLHAERKAAARLLSAAGGGGQVGLRWKLLLGGRSAPWKPDETTAFIEFFIDIYREKTYRGKKYPHL